MDSDCTVKLRRNPIQHKKLVRIGCGAGFAGDRPNAALKLLSGVPFMDYLVLECLAERTLAIRHATMIAGGKGYDPRISKWMEMLLPEAVKKGVCIITNMGANDPLGAEEEVFKIAKQYQLHITVGVAREMCPDKQGRVPGSCTYLGSAPILRLLEMSKPNVIITSRVADASLFLGPMIYELGWNWDDFQKLAQGTLAGHLLECGCQITGGYYAHPADEYRDMPIQQLLGMSLPYADVSVTGDVIISKLEGSGGELSYATCAQQLLYEVGDPSAYITPDLIVDFSNVTFETLTADKVSAKGALPGLDLRPERLLLLSPQDCGWKAWGEISYGGRACIQRAKMAATLVMAWMEASFPGSTENIIAYLIGVDSLLILPSPPERRANDDAVDIRLRMDGLFPSEDLAIGFMHEFEALYTNGPAGGGGICIDHRKEILLEKNLVRREETFWSVNIKATELFSPKFSGESRMDEIHGRGFQDQELQVEESSILSSAPSNPDPSFMCKASEPAPSDVEIPLYKVAHCRTGDKGNDLNFSLIPHCPLDLPRLKAVITEEWVKKVAKNLSRKLVRRYPIGPEHDHLELGMSKGQEDGDISVEIYTATGIHAMNVVVRNALDGGVNTSRRLDRHGKSLSDLFLCQTVILPTA